MHSTLPLLALSLLGALVLPAAALAQQTPEPAAEPAPAARPELLAEVLPVSTVREVAKPEKKILAGNVVDEWGNPLMGATVMVAGDQLHSVSTNSSGDYLLPVAGPAPVVRVSFAGYQDAECIARGPADLLFKLEPIEGYKRDLKKRSKAAVKAWKH
ncbi:carboxypeptidase-like regulatory domain-containing protein [Hymenobacter rigui]|uniref:Carboxypeptidase regulatory-like domain-containing protein n=1 Tax=Hymenobacter rigui TaxID=334424 RepID=A0A3R9NZU6_9BACT|nr:carboxypeptidase-like regulatory domain-containing protein [Hymenobacter rigui]RSK47139.1 carboxypeptidase regulatory-like domain-containing protein [Hymenobacter rigui]